MKKKFINFFGFTLIEVLIAIVITSLMMAAMFTSYNIVNSTYQQVTDRAKISQAGRDSVGTMLREIRMAGFKYLNDNIAASTEHNPIKIIPGDGFKGKCDEIRIVYGDLAGPPDASGNYEYTRIQITYKCKRYTTKKDTSFGNKVVGGFQLVKSRLKWKSGSFQDIDDTTYTETPVLDYVQDLVFIPYDKSGKPITSKSGDYMPSNNDAYDVRTIDIGLVVRSSKRFYKTDKDALKNIARKIISIATTTSSAVRNIESEDPFFRDTIVVTANARNVGLDQ
tara:strand:- start:127 stop:966 length:840 start_codon:yes stop_codon:yes gene_type:complete